MKVKDLIPLITAYTSFKIIAIKDGDVEFENVQWFTLASKYNEYKITAIEPAGKDTMELHLKVGD